MQATDTGTRRIVVLSTDTDVVVVLLYYWQPLLAHGLTELWVKTGVGDSTRCIPIHRLANAMGAEFCSILPALHALTGNDYTSKVGAKRSAMDSNPEKYLDGFGVIVNPDSLDLKVSSAEEYLVQVLKRGTTLKTMNQLRGWMYHHSKGCSLQDLPPTSYAVRLHILRAFYAANIMTSLLADQHPFLDPTLYGYVVENDLLIPDIGLRPVPEEFTVHCNCIKCAPIRCICRKSGLPCCSFCKCGSTTDEDACKNPSGFIH